MSIIRHLFGLYILDIPNSFDYLFAVNKNV